MRDTSQGRRGFDRVLMAVAASFVALSATTAVGQSAPARSAEDAAIDAAVPVPEPANVPPPSINDIKAETDSAPASAPAPVAAAPASSAPAASAPAASASTNSAPAPQAAPAAESVSPATAKSDASPSSTETPKAPAQAASTIPAADQPVAAQLRELLTGKSVKLFDRKAERVAVEKFFAARDYAPLWTASGVATPLAKSVTARLQDAAAEGLVPADYPVPDFTTATTPAALAEAELKFTAAVLDYARHAQSGRMHYSQVSADILYPEHPVDPAQVLTNVSTARDPSAALASYNPPLKLYRDLKAKLAELRGETNGHVITIADGAELKYVPARKKKPAVEMDDPRVPQLRTRLGVTENADSTRYDAKVAAAVRKFQDSVDLPDTGVLDERTVKALNSPKRDRHIDIVLVNMERLRWLPRELGVASLGNAYVILNIPDFTLKVMQNEAQVWSTRVVTGKPGKHATPMLTETMKYITVNPTWNVPPSIIYNEYLPALQQDPTVLQRMGLRLERNRDGSIHISQPPGEGNALGRLRFNFPNKFLVYQHDTPDKHLFARDVRAFSHGCMRVQNPDQYAATLLNIAMPNEHYSAERIRGMYGRSEIDLKFPTPIPVNITYQTAFVDDAGKLQFRKDIYGRDEVMIALMRDNRGKDLESIVAHAQPSYSRPRADIPQGVAFNDNGASQGPSGFSFFERLFGLPPHPGPTQRPPRNVFAR